MQKYINNIKNVDYTPTNKSKSWIFTPTNYDYLANKKATK